jgi:MFS family permease
MQNGGQVRRELVPAICCMSMLVVGLDVTALNGALPSIQKDFGASVSGAQWTIDAYTLVIACLLMLAGPTGDRLGRRRTFQVGLATFTLGSALCVSGMPREQAGVAGAVASTTRQLGSAFGVAIIGSVIASHVTHIVAGPAFNSASRVSWAIIAFCGLTMLGVGSLTTGAWGRRLARANAAKMEARSRL